MSKVVFKSLGITKYSDALEKMKDKLGEKNFKNEIWFLEHFKVFTLGTAANKAHVLDPKDIPVYQSDRGGEVTYHGPGQLVIYFLLDFKKLNMGPKTLVETLQKFVQSILDEFDIESGLIAGAPGVYVDDKKIASIGLRISNGKTYHGISINIDMDLEPFSYINPCGYEGLKVVQLKDYVNNIAIKDVEKLAIKKLENIF
ncbi:MAG: lipoyl(octanoyl) transferase LipB [Gammaproteobacteria bacterium]|uniref:Octanoyltransferase n=1 Tax=SAR86 cluster bacterium TaxID=2030880 RepID=A0A838YRA7_9GAMM|nr:lipoyl(octanoyl) transferase LipB [SAR86 cluster bacterium]